MIRSAGESNRDQIPENDLASIGPGYIGGQVNRLL